MISHIRPGPRGTVRYIGTGLIEQFFGAQADEIDADEAERIGRALIDAAEKSRDREWTNAGGTLPAIGSNLDITA